MSEDRPNPAFTPLTLRMRKCLGESVEPLWVREACGMQVDAAIVDDAICLLFRRKDQGGFLLRAVPERVDEIQITPTQHGLNCRAQSPSGMFETEFEISSDSVRVRTFFEPAQDVTIPVWPRDLFVLDAGNDPLGAQGRVEASQRGLNAGVCYFTSQFGCFLYLQSLSSLNLYFRDAGVCPDGAVGGDWPELGYEIPGYLQPGASRQPLKKGTRYTISDARLTWLLSSAEDEYQSARNFLELLGRLYPDIGKPKIETRDWERRALRTRDDLETAPDVLNKFYGSYFPRPYLGAESPDVMTQLAICAALHRFERGRGERTHLYEKIRFGVNAFFDEDLSMLRRYLPNVGPQKDRDVIDSWYLYHPLKNLGVLALDDDEDARQLFFKSLPYAIEAAHQFQYLWPIEFSLKDFEITKPSRNESGLGQTDVGGLYAYIMLQAYDLSGDLLYRNEAKAALRAARKMRFELCYQTNLTAWGAAACAKLAQLEPDSEFLDQSMVYIAGFIHNCQLWESEIGVSKHFKNFLGASCLHDGPYMAAFECFDSFDAFGEYLAVAVDAPESVQLLLSEYRKYALDRAWFFYPDALPEDAVEQDDIRNGRIDRNLCFPLEDLYVDGQKAGKVGKEVYGCGGAFIFAEHMRLSAMSDNSVRASMLV